mmetsp:Transcript_7765/g.22165  ORF Transcript_7765/g.22165 Transcript_7765/m.22165 type:complete len:251 (+) Transcript_7765:1751-2503(+)
MVSSKRFGFTKTINASHILKNTVIDLALRGGEDFRVARSRLRRDLVGLLCASSAAPRAGPHALPIEKGPDQDEARASSDANDALFAYPRLSLLCRDLNWRCQVVRVLALHGHGDHGVAYRKLVAHDLLLQVTRDTRCRLCRVIKDVKVEDSGTWSRTQDHDALFRDPELLHEVVLEDILVELWRLEVVLERKLDFHGDLDGIQDAGAVVLVRLCVKIHRLCVCAAWEHARGVQDGCQRVEILRRSVGATK